MGHPPNLMTQDVLGLGAAMRVLRPIHPIDCRLYRRAYRAETDSWPRGNAREPSARKIGVDPKRSRLMMLVIHINTGAQYIIVIAIIALGLLALSPGPAFGRPGPSFGIRMNEDGPSGRYGTSRVTEGHY